MTSKIITYTTAGTWEDHHLVHLDDDAAARYYLIYTGWQETDDLTCTIDLGQFNSTDIIIGIKVTIKKTAFGADYKMLDRVCGFYSSGTLVSSNYADTTNYWDYDGTGYKYRLYGAEGDAWGMSLTGADLNTGNYDFRFRAQMMYGTGTIVYVDWIQIEVFYIEGTSITDTFGPAIQVI
jgi:hypothetical protein